MEIFIKDYLFMQMSLDPEAEDKGEKGEVIWGPLDVSVWT